MKDNPKVGLAAILLNDKMEVLLGLRKSKLGNNKWAFPGGKLEKNENFQDCIIREVSEETNLNIQKLTYIGVTNDIIKDDNEHYVTILFSSNVFTGDLKLMEPDKCSEWKWFNINDLPNDLFLSTKNFINGNIFA